MADVTRGTPRHCFISRDGENQIKLVPVMQGDKLRSYYVVILQKGRRGKPDVLAEVNLTLKQLQQFGYAAIAASVDKV